MTPTPARPDRPMLRRVRGQPPLAAAVKTRGFTLLELMLTITVAAVILGLGIPNMTQFIRNNRMTSAANDVLAGIHLARTEAVKRRAFTTFCFTASPNDATPACTHAGRGWIVFVDDADPTATHANDANYAVDAGEEILLRHDPLPAEITSMRKVPATTTRGLVFTGSGFARTTSNPLTNLVLCDQRGNTAVYGAENSAARALVISATGRPQVNRAVAQVTSAGGC